MPFAMRSWRVRKLTEIERLQLAWFKFGLLFTGSKIVYTMDCHGNPDWKIVSI